MTTRELSEDIYRLRDVTALRINPGLANPSEWQTVGYKGGSEPGVLNFTHVLKKNDESPWYTISMTINNDQEEVNQKAFGKLATRLIHLIEAGKVR